MPEGLVAVTRCLGPGRSRSRRGVSRTGRPRTRRLVRPLLGVTLAIVGVMTPVESASLPAELDGLAGASPVLAQGAVVEGTPNLCEVGWYVNSTGSECHLDTEPCPTTPVPELGAVLRFSVEYPDTDGLTLVEYPGFCELRILLDVDDSTTYDTCKGMTGFAVMDYDIHRVVGGVDETVTLCRLLQPAACPAGDRVDVDICRTIQRRTWTCPDTHRLMNEYNRCYQRPPQFTGPLHPACDDGAPVFVVQDCKDYVGDDFAPSPTPIDCAGAYPTGDPTTALKKNSNAGASSKYWCEFNTMYTKTVCHGTNPPLGECATLWALCLKRSTNTGGCSGIAKTIRCRALEADYHADPLLTAPEVRRAGCQPCLVLPFRSIPPECPDDLSARSRSTPYKSLFDLFQVQRDDSNCADPARGRLTWSSTHFSQVAVVNAPVILSVLDIPAEVREGRLKFSGGKLVGERDTLPYPESPAGGFGYSMARFGNVDPDESGLVSVSDLVDLTGECVFWDEPEPQFQLTIRELWPDNAADRADIDSLIGSSALAWWDDLLPEEQEARTLDRWPDLEPADRAVRLEELTEVLTCNHSLPVWCRWTPARSGYYKISGAAVWLSKRWVQRGRRIMTARQADRIAAALDDPATRDSVRDQLDEWGATPEDVGLRDTLDGVLPLTGLNSDTMYSGTESQFSCAGTDIRVFCNYKIGSRTSDSKNYTETDPIGIMVHEVRVATRSPNS